MAGIIYAHSKPKAPLTAEAYTEAVNGYLPGVLAVPEVKALARYASCSNDGTFLTLAPVTHAANAAASNMKIQPDSSHELIAGMKIEDVVDIDQRILEVVEVNPKDSGDIWSDPSGNTATLILIQYTSSTSSYQNALAKVSQIKGYKRSVLVKEVNKKGADMAPRATYCGIHAFVGDESLKKDIEGKLDGGENRFFRLLKKF